MSTWDFLHPGLPDDPSVDTWSGGHHSAHFDTDPLGHIHHQDAMGIDHGTTVQDQLGIHHHFGHDGMPTGTSRMDPLGHVHHTDAFGHEQFTSWLDPLGIAHHVSASGGELAHSHFDALGHLQFDASPHAHHVPEPSPGAADPAHFLNSLLRPF